MLHLGKARAKATSSIWEWGTLNRKRTNLMVEVLDAKWWACLNCPMSTLGDTIKLEMESTLSSLI